MKTPIDTTIIDAIKTIVEGTKTMWFIQLTKKK